MVICLSKNNPIVKEWFDSVGERETYKQFIFHNYALPSYSEYNKVQSFNISSAEDLLKNYLNPKLYSIEHLREIQSEAETASAAFFRNILYFNESLDQREFNEEVFHAVFQTLTTPAERKDLYIIAERLLNERLKRNKISKQSLFDNYKKALGKDVTYDYILEEELAKEYVNFSTYNGRVTREQEMKYLWGDKDSSIFEKLWNSLSNFFRRIFSLRKNYVKNPKLLQNYFEKINRGDFKNSVQQSLENQVNREYPSLSTIQIYNPETDSTQLLSPISQSIHYGKITNILRTLQNEEFPLVGEDNIPYTTEGLIKEAITTYANEFLIDSIKSEDQWFFEELVDEFNEEETETFKNVVKDITDKYRQIISVMQDIEDDNQSNTDDIGWSRNPEFDSLEPNQKDPFVSLSREIKTIIGTTTIESNDDLLKTVTKKVLKNGEIVEAKVEINNKRLIEPYKVFNSVASITADTSSIYEKLKKLSLYTRDNKNIETNAFLNAVLSKVYTRNGNPLSKQDLSDLKELLIKDPENLENFELINYPFFNKIGKSFMLSTSEQIIMNVKEGELSSTFNPAFSAAVETQISNWQTEFESMDLNDVKKKVEDLDITNKFLFIDLKDRSEKNILKIVKTIERLKNDFNKFSLNNPESDLDFATWLANDTRNVLDKLLDVYNISVSELFKDWIVADHLGKFKDPDIYIPQKYAEVYDNFLLNNSDFNIDFSTWDKVHRLTFVEGFEINGISVENDPYSKAYTEKDVEEVFNLKSELENMARGNIRFDESTLPSTFRNAELKSVWRFQQPTQFLRFANEIVRDRNKFDKYIDYVQSVYEGHNFYLDPLKNTESFEGNEEMSRNLFIQFLDKLSNSERKRLSSVSLAGMNKIDDFISVDGVSNDLDSDKFAVFQLNLILNNAYQLREGVKNAEGEYIESSIISAPYFKGVNEVSKTKSFLTGQWYKSIRNPIDDRIKSLFSFKNGKTIIDDGAVVLSKNILQQDMNRVKFEFDKYKNIIDSLHLQADIPQEVKDKYESDPRYKKIGSLNTFYKYQENLLNPSPENFKLEVSTLNEYEITKEGSKKKLVLSAHELRTEYGYDKVSVDYHAGIIPLIYTNNEWTIDFKEILNNSKGVPRSLIFMKDLNGILNNRGRELIYERIASGNFDIVKYESQENFRILSEEDKNKVVELDTEIKKAIKDILEESLSLLKDPENLKILDIRFTENSTNDYKNTQAKILGFKLDENQSPEEGGKLESGISVNATYLNNPNLVYNLSLTIFNSLINRQSMQRMLHGNLAILNKDENLEFAKRNKQETSATASAYAEKGNEKLGVDEFKELSYIIEESANTNKVKSDEPKELPISGISGDVIDSNDAQGSSSVNSRKKLLYGMDVLTEKIADLLDDVHNGVDIDSSTTQDIIVNNRYLNAEKTLIADPFVTGKMSESLLTKHLTATKKNVTDTYDKSTWREDIQLVNVRYNLDGSVRNYQIYPRTGTTKEITIEPVLTKNYPTIQEALDNLSFNVFEWVPISKDLNDRRKLLDGWKQEQGVWKYQGLDKRVDLHMVTSASKRQSFNVWDGRLENFDVNFHKQTVSTEYYGRQQANPIHDSILDPSQQLEILTYALPEIVNFIDSNGKKQSLKREEVVSLFHKKLNERNINALNLFMNITTKEGKIREDLMYKIVQESLMETSGDRQLIEFFNLNEDNNPLYNSNLPSIARKYEQQLLSYIGKDVLAHKVKGDSFAMMSPKGYKLLKKLKKVKVKNADGSVSEVISWDVIRKDSEEFKKNYSNAISLADDLVYNGYQREESNDKSLTTTLENLLASNTSGNVYFLDELRMNKPVVERSSNGKSEIVNYYAESLIPPKDARDLTHLHGANRFIQGVRIPSQSKSTSANIEVVDFLPVYYGNTIMITKEIQELAGSDFDIDKIYVHMYEGYYTEDGAFKKYQNTVEDFKKYILNTNRAVKRVLRDTLKEDEEFQDLKSQRRTLRENINKFENQLRLLESQLLEDSENTRVESERYELIKQIDFLTSEIENERVKDNKATITFYENQLKDIIEEESQLGDIVKLRSVFQKLKGVSSSIINSTESDYSRNEEQAKIITEQVLLLIKSIVDKNQKEIGTSFIEVFEKLIEINEDIQIREEEIEQDVFDSFFPNFTKSSLELYKTSAAINNEILDMKKMLLTANMDAFTSVITVDKVKGIFSEDKESLNNIHNIKDKNGKLFKLVNDINSPFNSIVFDMKYLLGAGIGKDGIALTVTGNLAWLVNVRAGIKLTDSTKFKINNIPKVGTVVIDKFEENLQTITEESLIKVSDRISEIISAATDEAKEGIISRLNLRGELLSLYMAGLSIGIDNQLITAVLNKPYAQSIIKQTLRTDFQRGSTKKLKDLLIDAILNDDSFKGKNYSLENIRELEGNNEYDFNSLVSSDNNLSTLLFLDRLSQISEQNKDLLKLVRLKKGLPNEVLDVIEIGNAIRRLGIQFGGKTATDFIHQAYEVDIKKPGFEQIQGYIETVLPELMKVIGNSIIQLNPNYAKVKDTLYESIGVKGFSNYTTKKVYEGINRALLGELQTISGSPESLDVRLLIGENSLPNRFNTLKNHPELKDLLKTNLLFNKLSVNLGYKKQVEKIIRRSKLNKDSKRLQDELKNKVELDSFMMNMYSKMTPEMQNSFLDSTIELTTFNKSGDPILNKEVESFANDLYNYITVKEAQEYSPTGIGKVINTAQFKGLSHVYDEFQEGKIKDIDENVVDRFVRDINNFEYLPKFEREEMIIEDLKLKNIIVFKSTLTLRDLGESNHNKYIRQGNRLYKQVSSEFKKDKYTESFYIEIPLLGTKRYHASVANINIVSDFNRTTEIINNLKSYYNEHISNPIYEAKLSEVKSELNKIADHFAVRVTTKSGENITSENLVKDFSDIQVTVLPMSSYEANTIIKIDNLNPLSPYHVQRVPGNPKEKGLKIDGQSYYSISHYLKFQKSLLIKEENGGKTLQNKIFNASTIEYPTITVTLPQDKQLLWEKQELELMQKAYLELFKRENLQPFLQLTREKNINLISNEFEHKKYLPVIYSTLNVLKSDQNVVTLSIPKQDNSTGLDIIVNDKTPEYIKMREFLKADFSDYYLHHSKQKKGYGYEVAQQLDSSLVNPDSSLVSGKTIMVGVDSKILNESSDFENYKKDLLEYINAGATIITDSDYDMLNSAENQSLNENRVDGSVGMMRLIDNFLRESGYSPIGTYLTNGEQSVFVNSWNNESRMLETPGKKIESVVGEENSSFKDRNVFIMSSTQKYTKDSPLKNSNYGYVFTENLEDLGSTRNVNMTQAIIRTDSTGKRNQNVLPIITKKGGKVGEFLKDTEEDFTLFKESNTKLIQDIVNSKYESIVFPNGYATEKAKLPVRFTEWLSKEFNNKLFLETELTPNKDGFRLTGKRFENRETILPGTQLDLFTIEELPGTSENPKDC